MRPSNRDKILDAAARVVQREGVTSVTLESVAAEAELTKGGLMYHFPTRDALLQAIHQYLADRWERSMVDAAGKTATEASSEERLAAYTRVCTQSATRAELLFMLEGSTHPNYTKPWTEALDRWAPSAELVSRDPAALAQFIARLAADGLWLYESLTSVRLPPKQRALIAERIIQAIDGSRDRLAMHDGRLGPGPGPATGTL